MPVTRGGGPKKQKMAERRCIVTGDILPKSELIRFVAGPENKIVPDVAGKLPGRGIWVSARKAVLEKAIKNRLFARGARKQVTIPVDLLEQVDDLLARHVVKLISLARKGGDAISGFEKVKDSVVSGSVAVLLQARDGSQGQKGKIRPPKGEKSLISCLFGHELGLAFGRENVIHAALAAGGLDRRIVEEAARLAGVRDGHAPIGVKQGVKDE